MVRLLPASAVGATLRTVKTAVSSSDSWPSETVKLALKVPSSA